MVARLLVANRGEIARRIARTCRRMGIEVVAVHSDADADAPHVREADRAVRIGPAPPAASYLDVAAVVDAAVRTGCDAVHPGYGFLAESAPFARAVRDAGLTFVGPPPEVIALMGDKAAAKRRLAAAGVPVLEGTDGDLDDAALLEAAARIGPPLLVKAVAGGGGTGMRRVAELRELPDALVAARREAEAAFGDGRVLLERRVERPRHVEVQVVADTHGTVLHLFERECSIQRRHQKVVEEAPSPAVTEPLRTAMTRAAVRAAAEVGYVGVGTLEFLVDAATLSRRVPDFAFLEMNTRLQVEHPVTEAVTGLDLVELALRVADGEPLPLSQDDVRIDGHAIEVRVYAEDPVTHLPQTGTIAAFEVPPADQVRVDSGVEVGSRIGPHYDPMLAKLVVHAADRPAACERLAGVLEATSIRGVTTNVPLLAAIVASPAFREGTLHTGFLDEHLGGWRPQPPTPRILVAAARAVLGAATRGTSGPVGAFVRAGPFRLGGVGGASVRLELPAADDGLADGTDTRRAAHVVVLRADRGGGPLAASLDDAEVAASDLPSGDVRTSVVTADDGSTEVWVHDDGRTVRLLAPPATHRADPSAPSGLATFASPMPGTVLTVPVAAGEHVERGAVLLTVEAMKMEHPVRAPTAGTVEAVHVAVGDAVAAGERLVSFDPDVEAHA